MTTQMSAQAAVNPSKSMPHSRTARSASHPSVKSNSGSVIEWWKESPELLQSLNPTPATISLIKELHLIPASLETYWKYLHLMNGLDNCDSMALLKDWWVKNQSDIQAIPEWMREHVVNKKDRLKEKFI